MHQALLRLVIGFEWDEGNRHKSWRKHRISLEEAEQAFVNDDMVMALDQKHSRQEARYYVFGKTNGGKKLSIAFTVRSHKIRVIMARTMSKKERAWYEKEIEKNS